MTSGIYKLCFLSKGLCILCVCSPACMHVCVSHVCSTYKGQKSTSDPLKLQLLVVVSWELNLGPLQEQVLLIAEPPLQAVFFCLCVCFCFVCFRTGI